MCCGETHGSGRFDEYFVLWLATDMYGEIRPLDDDCSVNV